MQANARTWTCGQVRSEAVERSVAAQTAGHQRTTTERLEGENGVVGSKEEGDPLCC
jgi:hypothetical protein